MSVRSPTAGTWFSSQWRPDNEFETDRRHAVRQRRMAMPLRWKTSGLLGSRRANAATNRQSAANRALISRLLGVNRPFIGCEGARQRFTHVAEPFADTFLLGDVTVTSDHVQPRLARRPPPRALTRWCVARGGGAARCAWRRRRSGARARGAPRARSPAGQGNEVVLGCEILNRMTALGRPASYRIGR